MPSACASSGRCASSLPCTNASWPAAGTTSSWDWMAAAMRAAAPASWAEVRPDGGLKASAVRNDQATRLCSVDVQVTFGPPAISPLGSWRASSQRAAPAVRPS